MNRSTLLTLFLVALMPISLMAQKSKVISGVLAYEDRAYEEAINDFKTALKDKSSLKEKTPSQSL